MKTPPVNNLILERMNKLKAKKVFSILAGDIKSARQASKEYASLAVEHFDLALQTYNPVKGSIPAFSKVGWNCIKFIFAEKFRRFTPQEKQLNKLIKKWKIEQKAKSYMA